MHFFQICIFPIVETKFWKSFPKWIQNNQENLKDHRKFYLPYTVCEKKPEVLFNLFEKCEIRILIVIQFFLSMVSEVTSVAKSSIKPLSIFPFILQISMPTRCRYCDSQSRKEALWQEVLRGKIRGHALTRLLLMYASATQPTNLRNSLSTKINQQGSYLIPTRNRRWCLRRWSTGAFPTATPFLPRPGDPQSPFR